MVIFIQWDSNLGSLVSEATALPTVPQLPISTDYTLLTEASL